MLDWFRSLDPMFQALLAGLFTWGVTTAGAATVFIARDINRKFLDAMLGFSGGVMLAASYWSLLAPAIQIADAGPTSSWLPPTIGFLLGGAVLWIFDKSLPHLHLGFPIEEAEGPQTAWHRSVLWELRSRYTTSRNRTERAMSTLQLSACCSDLS